MNPATPQNWERIKVLFDAALRQPPERREQFLSDVCGGDLGLANEVRELLAHHFTNVLPCSSDVAPYPGPTAPPSAGSADAAAPQPPAVPAGASDSALFHHGRFLPGTLLAARYRIVAMLGRGGMGEVYRADDLKLGQTVALKFLPARLADDPGQLARFHSEVRLARHVSHPGACRVHDIGEADGQPFLSMQYIDGEDLAALLRRSGRIAGERGVELARQLCAALAAAHAQGVLHRDLKPSNVMIDGRGRAVITDFGLAELAEQARGDDEPGPGTPAYMAPEQLAGREVSVRSDLYSLGLVLYEMLTGHQAFRGCSFDEARRFREAHPRPRPPRELIDGFDPAVERAIMTCLEEEPADRPPSALAVLAAMPGGDPLAAAMAAGETPSPEMVAAAGAQNAGITLRIGVTCLLGCIVGLVLAIVLSGSSQLLNRTDMTQRPDYLHGLARRIVHDLGHDAIPGDVAHGFHFDFPFIQYVIQQGGHWDRLAQPPGDDALDRPGLSPVYFWYRESPEPMAPRNFFDFNTRRWRNGPGTVTVADPALNLSGMVLVKLDPGQGRLLEFRALPPEAPAAAPSTLPGQQEAPWSKLFRAAELDPTQWQEAEPAYAPAVHGQTRRAWVHQGPQPFWRQWPEMSARIEAAALEDRIVWFRLLKVGSDGQIIGDSRDRADLLKPEYHAAWVLDTILHALAFIIGAALAVWNLRLGRGDRRGAMRLAQLAFFTSLLAWALQADHAASLSEWHLIQTGLAWAMLMAGQLWVYYIGVEPYVRRFWPQAMISWSRLLAGRWRDPLVGRDVLVGLLVGVTMYVLSEVDALVPQWLDGSVEAKWRWARLYPLDGLRHWVAEVLLALWWAFEVGLLYILMMFLVLKHVLRNVYLAAAVFIAYHASIFALNAGNHHLVVFVSTAVQGVLALMILLRLGLLACMAGWFAYAMLWFPITPDLGRWYAGAGLMAAAIIAALAAYCLQIALGGRTVLGLDRPALAAT